MILKEKGIPRVAEFRCLGPAGYEGFSVLGAEGLKKTAKLEVLHEPSPFELASIIGPVLSQAGIAPLAIAAFLPLREELYRLWSRSVK